MKRSIDLMRELADARPARLTPGTDLARRERDLARAFAETHADGAVVSRPPAGAPIRRRMAVGLAAASVAATVAAGAFAGYAGSHDNAPGSSATESQAGALPIELVAYTGTQPQGYTLKTIPKGWTVDEATDTYLTLRRTTAGSGGDFTDKILVGGSYADKLPTGDESVTVNGAQGSLFYAGNKTVSGIIYDSGHTVAGIDPSPEGATPRPDDDGAVPRPDGDGTVPRPDGDDATPRPRHGVKAKASADDKDKLFVEVQMPGGLNWDRATALKFVSGVTVQKFAKGAFG